MYQRPKCPYIPTSCPTGIFLQSAGVLFDGAFFPVSVLKWKLFLLLEAIPFSSNHAF